MPETDQFKLKVFRGTDGFRQIKQQWQQLITPAEASGFYHCAQWYEAIIECLDKDPESFRFYCIFTNDRLAAIFPFKKYVRHHWGRRIHSLELFKHSHLPLADIILPETGRAQEIWQFFIEQLRSAPVERWDFIRFKKVPASSNLSFVLSTATHFKILKYRMKGCFLCPRTSPKALSRKISPSFRKSLRNARNRLAKLGDSSFSQAQTAPEMEEFFQEFLHVEASGWKAQTGTAIAQDDRLISFYRKLMETFGPESCLLLTLKIKNKTIAANFDLMIGQTLFTLKTGIDDQYRSCSPGQLMTQQELTRAGASPHHLPLLNFTGEAAGGIYWRPESMAINDICIVNTGRNARIICARITLKYKLRELYRRTAKPLVKRFTRKPLKKPSKRA